jgi:hypothetical protein
MFGGALLPGNLFIDLFDLTPLTTASLLHHTTLSATGLESSTHIAAGFRSSSRIAGVETRRSYALSGVFKRLECRPQVHYTISPALQLFTMAEKPMARGEAVTNPILAMKLTLGELSEEIRLIPGISKKRGQTIDDLIRILKVGIGNIETYTDSLRDQLAHADPTVQGPTDFVVLSDQRRALVHGERVTHLQDCLDNRQWKLEDERKVSAQLLKENKDLKAHNSRLLGYVSDLENERDDAVKKQDTLQRIVDKSANTTRPPEQQASDAAGKDTALQLLEIENTQLRIELQEGVDAVEALRQFQLVAERADGIRRLTQQIRGHGKDTNEEGLRNTETTEDFTALEKDVAALFEDSFRLKSEVEEKVYWSKELEIQAEKHPNGRWNLAALSKRAATVQKDLDALVLKLAFKGARIAQLFFEANFKETKHRTRMIQLIVLSRDGLSSCNAKIAEVRTRLNKTMKAVQNRGDHTSGIETPKQQAAGTREKLKELQPLREESGKRKAGEAAGRPASKRPRRKGF